MVPGQPDERSGQRGQVGLPGIREALGRLAVLSFDDRIRANASALGLELPI